MMPRYRLGMTAFLLLLSFHAGAWRFAVTGDSRALPLPHPVPSARSRSP